jgi:hypothetical protein
MSTTTETPVPPPGHTLIWCNWDLSSSPHADPVFPREFFLEEAVIMAIPGGLRLPAKGERNRWVRTTDAFTGKRVDICRAPCDLDCYCAAGFRVVEED